jgi:hypothetical protein
MNTYQVIRPFSDYQAGDTLTEADFLSRQRADQLVSLRYIALVAAIPQSPRARRGKKEATDESTD